MAHDSKRITFTSSFGTKLSAIVAGKKQSSAVLLIHGFPSSAHMFRDIIPVLAESSYVIAPDLPGCGQSDILPTTSFDAYAKAVSELLEHLEIGSLFIYLHDYGAPVGFQIAMNTPERVLGLIIQNANAHRSGFGAVWEDTLHYWAHPTPEGEAATLLYLTREGTREQYTAGLPPEVAKRISPAVWEEDWRVMSLPGHLEVQRRLIGDYKNYAARFEAIGEYLKEHQPPALMVWGRHDPFFDIAETLSWMKDLPRMEAHIFDGGHILPETHAKPVAKLMRDFIASVQ